jgi:hypothetical protein
MTSNQYLKTVSHGRFSSALSTAFNIGFKLHQARLAWVWVQLAAPYLGALLGGDLGVAEHPGGFLIGGGLEAGAYTRSFFSST